jgi:hypothetical protein
MKLFIMDIQNLPNPKRKWTTASLIQKNIHEALPHGRIFLLKKLGLNLSEYSSDSVTYIGRSF